MASPKGDAMPPFEFWYCNSVLERCKAYEGVAGPGAAAGCASGLPSTLKRYTLLLVTRYLACTTKIASTCNL